MPDVLGLRPGDPPQVAGYRLVGRLGSGGQGVVYLATTPSGERVAIKRLLAEPQDDGARLRLAKEVSAARRVAPFCIAQVVDADLDGPSPYIVSEYIDGPSLQQRVRERGPITGSALRWTAIGTATALAAIHQAGIVHRDFKPANVMLGSDGPRVIDFGIARDLSTDLTVTSRVLGTPAYMAPEQIRAEPVGPAADLFAWASVIAYAGTGRAPFDGGHMLAVMHRITSEEPGLEGLPDDLVPVLRACLAKDPAQRPTAQQAVALLLGRPAPATEPRDATGVLAEAAGIVHQAAAGAGVTVRQPGVAATRVDRVARADRADLVTDRRNLNRTVVIAVVTVLVAVGIWAFGQHDRRRLATSAPPPAAATSTHRTTSSPPSAPRTTSPGATAPRATRTPSLPVPGYFAGIWEGTAYQPAGSVNEWTARVDLASGRSGRRMTLEGLGCSGPVVVTAATDRDLTLDVVIDSDPQQRCTRHATLRMTRLAFGRASFFWRDLASPLNVATGVLKKS